MGHSQRGRPCRDRGAKLFGARAIGLQGDDRQDAFVIRHI